jgi:hypothetical protein
VSLIRTRREIETEKVESAAMSNRNNLAVTSQAVAVLTALALAASLVACEDDTIHALPLDAGVTEIDAAPPPPVDSGADAVADAAPLGDAGPADATASDASRTDAATPDASSDATAD